MTLVQSRHFPKWSSWCKCWRCMHVERRQRIDRVPVRFGTMKHRVRWACAAAPLQYHMAAKQFYSGSKLGPAMWMLYGNLCFVHLERCTKFYCHRCANTRSMAIHADHDTSNMHWIAYQRAVLALWLPWSGQSNVKLNCGCLWALSDSTDVCCTLSFWFLVQAKGNHSPNHLNQLNRNARTRGYHERSHGAKTEWEKNK